MGSIQKQYTEFDKPPLNDADEPSSYVSEELWQKILAQVDAEESKE
jgi:hypothetical protein